MIYNHTFICKIIFLLSFDRVDKTLLQITPIDNHYGFSRFNILPSVVYRSF